MRILVVSDTHGDWQALAAVLGMLGRSVQALMHLGDGSGDIRSAFRSGVPMPPAYGVRGNVDNDSSVPLFRNFEADGGKIMIAHGHRFPLGEGMSCLASAAREQGARAIFYGHTHIPHYEERGDITILNPGSLSRPRGPWGPSLAIVEASSSTKSLDVKLYEVSGLKSVLRLRAIRF